VSSVPHKTEIKKINANKIKMIWICFKSNLINSF